MNAVFCGSSNRNDQGPKDNKPEWAVVGRSNVGKSSLINMLLDQKNLARISSEPGKTQLINHFLVNRAWYLVDLPGYGWAKVGKKERAQWQHMIRVYLLKRKNLQGVLVLIDSRHSPQQNDQKFIQWLGENNIPITIVFTKIDQVTKFKLRQCRIDWENILNTTWDALPPFICTSSKKKLGKKELLEYIKYYNDV